MPRYVRKVAGRNGLPVDQITEVRVLEPRFPVSCRHRGSTYVGLGQPRRHSYTNRVTPALSHSC